MKYKLMKTDSGKINTIEQSFDDGSKKYIPKDEDNTDYQEYQEWVAEGNTPMEADEETE